MRGFSCRDLVVARLNRREKRLKIADQFHDASILCRYGFRSAWRSRGKRVGVAQVESVVGSKAGDEIATGRAACVPFEIDPIPPVDGHFVNTLAQWWPVSVG